MTQHLRRGFAKRGLSVLSAAALAVTGLFIVGGTAASAVSTGDIVAPSSGGTIVVHKHSGNEGAAGSGTEITDTSSLGLGIDGVPFKIQRVAYNNVPIDLGTAEGWSHVPAGGLTVAQASTAPYSLVDVAIGGTQTTAGGGIATFSGLGLGLYVVTELAVTDPNGPVIETLAQPFIVSVPHRGANDNTWNYNVHVYPKNKIPNVSDKVVAAPTGTNVPWTITAQVPNPASGQTYTTNLTITDVLDTRLTYVSAAVVPSPAGSTVVYDPDTRTLVVTVPQAALVAGAIYTVNLVTTVTGPGAILNEAVVNTSGSSVNTGPAQTNWGKIVVTKQETGTNVLLDGAEFELYTAQEDPADRTIVKASAATVNGQVTFSNLYLGMETDTSEAFCLKEVTAPAGHSIAQEWTCVTVTTANNGTYEVTIHNPKRTTPNLPLTGSTGTTAFMAGGLALLLVAAGSALMVARKRRSEHAAE